MPIVSRVPISIRKATEADLPFIDGLQKKHSRELGFLPAAALVGKIELGQVLVAEGSMQTADGRKDTGLAPSPPTAYCPLPTPVGYLIAADRYFKRDEIGYITQINIVPEYRRHLVAGQLLQYQFDHSAYGCRLYSCWCAQDLKANEFWEAMGFTAIAFRTGSLTKGKGADGKRAPRIHIFWQKRIRAGDEVTPWWYPSQTGGGEMREDRLVFPIMPGMHWKDVLPVVLSGIDGGRGAGVLPALPREKKRGAGARAAAKVLTSPRMKTGLWFEEEGVVDAEPGEQAKPEKVKKEKVKIDPRLTTAARELRDQWQERSGQVVPAPVARHDIKRIAQAGAATGGLRLEQHDQLKRLEQAA